MYVSYEKKFHHHHYYHYYYNRPHICLSVSVGSMRDGTRTFSTMNLFMSICVFDAVSQSIHMQCTCYHAFLSHSHSGNFYMFAMKNT